MVFACAFCRLWRPEVKGGARRTTGKCLLTDENVDGARALLNMAHPDGAAHTPKLEVGQHLCLECFGEELRAQVTVMKNKKRSAGSLLIGRRVARWGGVIASAT